jgi:ADP-ribose pyrophosphatase
MSDPRSNSTVTNMTRTDAHSGFFKMGIFEFENEKFSGVMSPRVRREVFERGNAAAVLPYDPQRDTVLLIRQFLIGAHLAGRPNRPYQVVAGMIEAGETGEDVARREAAEESGSMIGRLQKAHHFLPSPGGMSEYIETYVGEADLPDTAGGLFGLADEDEDIIAEVMSADAAIALLDAGEIEAGPAVVLLSWFARHRDSIRRIWLTDCAI